MTQTIDPIKLKAAAEHLEWVLEQYPKSEDVQALLQSLRPIIEAAKSKAILSPADRIPGAYNFADGIYIPYKNPNLGNAYARFSIEIKGGLTYKDTQQINHLEAMLKTMVGSNNK